ARLGVTGLTDATPFHRLDDLTTLAEAVRAGHLPQRVVATGGVELAGSDLPAPLIPGPVKVILDEHDLPALEDLQAAIDLSHVHGRPLAVHCVTRASLVLALAAWEAAGATTGDRIEHGSV